jgi:tRNA (cmo5U34)-methyltransferase
VSDNATPHKADEYEREVRRTIPMHDAMLDEAILVALAAVPQPRRWLDTGAGPGELVRRARHALGERTDFFVADPAAAMLELARAKNPGLDGSHFLLAGSAALPDLAPFDVITAVQCHHYGDRPAREAAVRRCFELLASPGVLVVFENVRADTEVGHRMQRHRWAAWQVREGRDEETVVKHIAREGVAFQPIAPSEHLALFGRVGFDGAELVFRNYAQGGFVAWKGAVA